jgi:hypothetical protein
MRLSIVLATVASGCAGTPVVVLEGTLPRPIVVHVDGSGRAPQVDCVGVPVPSSAIAQVIVSIEHPPPGLVVALRPTPEASILALVAPVSEGQASGECRSAKHVFQSARPGRYRVWALASDTKVATSAAWRAFDACQKRDPTEESCLPLANAANERQGETMQAIHERRQRNRTKILDAARARFRRE